MQIVPVNAPEQFAEFINCPWVLHENDPFWIPPLRQQVAEELSETSAFAGYARFRLYLCKDGGRVAGRIAAIVNPMLVTPDGIALGQLGYFECIKDDAISAALIHAGIEWLQSQGVREVLAPMNGGAHRMHRFLTRGFDREPFLWEPRNPPYYPDMFETCSFKAAGRWFSYEVKRDEAAARLQQLNRVLSRRPPPGHFEALSLDKPELATMRIHKLLDTCWAGHLGYTALGLHEFAELFRGPMSIMRSGDVTLFVRNGTDLGFSLIYPDYAREVRSLRGDASGWGNWLEGPLPKRIVLHTVAMYPEIRKTSAALAFVAEAFRHSLSDDFEEFIVALAVNNFLENIGECTREYTLYSRSI